MMYFISILIYLIININETQNEIYIIHKVTTGAQIIVSMYCFVLKWTRAPYRICASRPEEENVQAGLRMSF